jgi:hypothetical protein
VTELMLAALRWDPQIRGALIVLTGVTILIGSVYMLLATNTGARLGFMIAAAGLFGWMAVMGVVWMVFGIGIKGAEPSWKPLEVVTGDLSQSTVEVARRFPDGWKPLPKTDPALADAEGTADALLSGEGGGESEGGEGGHGGEEGGGAEEETLRIEPPFEKKSDYRMAEAFKSGGEDWFILGIRHRPHYVAIQVEPTANAPGDVQGKSPTTVIMLRDLGNLRAPSFFFALFSAIMFGIFSYSLHYRDKQAAARRASVP